MAFTGARPRRAAPLLAVALLVAFSGCGSSEPSAIKTDKATLAGLRRQDPDANKLLPGGKAEFERRLRAAKGHPVVVNQWASWCGPCRFEFPIFQRLAKRYRGRIVFLGVNTQDNAGDARAFLAKYPTPYPHISDPDGAVARVFHGGRAFPTTVFYDAQGKLVYTHLGGYQSERQLVGDVEKYALGRSPG